MRWLVLPLLIVAPACASILGLPDDPPEDVRADATTTDASDEGDAMPSDPFRDAGAPSDARADARDGSAVLDGATLDADTGAPGVLAVGASIVVYGATTDGYAIFDDQLDLYAVPLTGGSVAKIGARAKLADPV